MTIATPKISDQKKKNPGGGGVYYRHLNITMIMGRVRFMVQAFQAIFCGQLQGIPIQPYKFRSIFD